MPTDEKCPVCDAEPGAPCVSLKTGRPTGGTHQARWLPQLVATMPKDLLEKLMAPRKRPPLIGDPTYVYVIGFAGRERPVKIGMAQNVPARLDGLQTGHHDLLEIKSSREFPSRPAAEKAERRAHRHFASKRLRGEWFDLDAAKATAWIAR